MRTLIDVPDSLVEALDTLARQHNRSRAAEVREALANHLRDRATHEWIARGSGYWKGREDIGDPVDYQRLMRQDRDPA